MIITEASRLALVTAIYNLLMSNPEMGMGEMGDCHEAAEILVDEWMTDQHVNILQLC